MTSGHKLEVPISAEKVTKKANLFLLPDEY